MKRLHIFNPAAGGGNSPALLTQGAASDEESYITTGVGDAENFIYRICQEREETHFVVHGGDGTLNEAANGIIKAEAGNRTLLSVVPAGTGNDFVRSFPEKDRIYEIDAMKYNDRYAINIINFGFDSRVVAKTGFYKKIFPGSVAYLAGVVDTFCHKIGESWEIEFESESGETEKLSREFTLALAANCQYYGGGFRSASLANPSDGLIDLITVDRVSRVTFLKLIGNYKKGTHLDPVAKAPYEKFRHYLLYKRYRKIKISGISNLCADGEIEPCESVEISIVPKVLRIAT